MPAGTARFFTFPPCHTFIAITEKKLELLNCGDMTGIWFSFRIVSPEFANIKWRRSASPPYKAIFNKCDYCAGVFRSSLILNSAKSPGARVRDHTRRRSAAGSNTNDCMVDGARTPGSCTMAAAAAASTAL